MTQLEGRTILVTGGASGLGRLVAEKASKLGARVVVWDVDTDALQRVTDELRAGSSEDVRGYACDISDREAVSLAASRVSDEFGPVDILVNNAGVVAGKRLLDCSEEEITRTINVNAMALFWTARAFLPEMVRRAQGHVVTIASAAGLIGVTGMVDYCASKWAAVGFDEALRVELKRTAPGVKTTVVCPYFVDTGMFDGVTTRFPFLLPVLKAEYVADRIIRAIRRNKRRLMMPRIVYLLPFMRILPTGLFDALAGLLGINHAMDGFVGHCPSASEMNGGT
jgi:all-trans-retinol dehydrogenase (NAD+)